MGSGFGGVGGRLFVMTQRQTMPPKDLLEVSTKSEKRIASILSTMHIELICVTLKAGRGRPFGGDFVDLRHMHISGDPVAATDVFRAV